MKKGETLFGKSGTRKEKWDPIWKRGTPFEKPDLIRKVGPYLKTGDSN